MTSRPSRSVPPTCWQPSTESSGLTHLANPAAWTCSTRRCCCPPAGAPRSCRGTIGYLLSLRLRLHLAGVPLGDGSAHLVRVALCFGRAARDSPACDEDRGGEDSGRKQGTHRLSPGEDPVEPRVRNARDCL